MKKRIACILMALILLVSLAPTAALTADAATRSTSEAAITILKSMTQFKSQCYQVAKTDEFRIGYGTACPGSHKVDKNGIAKNEGSTSDHIISQTAADEALRAALKQMDTKVNSFASSNGLNLSQNQHDALVLFSYNSGVAWMDGTSVVKTAIVNGADTNDLLNAMNEWTKNADPSRRKVEVNMYVNGVYSVMAPTNYSNVTYNANKGDMAQKTGKDQDDNILYVMQYDTTETVAHEPVPTKAGMTFVGWYLSGYQWKPSLTADCAGKILVALWQTNGQKASDDAGVDVSYTLARSSLASRTIYNIPDVSLESCKSVGTVESSSVKVIRDYIGTDGTRWSKIANNQWVIVKAGSNGVGSGGTDIDVTVTVTNSYVNMRVNATIHSKQNGRWSQGDQLRIINTDSADGFLWGQIAKSDDDDTPIGWVALMYTNWNAVKDGADSSTSTKVIARAVITINGYVQVRSDAGTDNKIVGSLAKNDTVDVYEIKTVDGHQWGRTGSGWFCLTYASVTMVGSNADAIISDEGALDYSFTGKLIKAETPRVQPTDNSNAVVSSLAAGTSVTVTNLTKNGDETWGKIVWRVDTNDDGKLDSNKAGWVEVGTLTTSSSSRVRIDTARFKVVSDVKIKNNWTSGSDTLFTLTSGVEFTIDQVKLSEETIWGYTSKIEFVDDSMTTANNQSYTGWVNLASKYVSRMDAPTIEGSTTPNTGLMATVINSDSVNVRNYGSTTSGKIIGSIARGTTVAVWESNEDTNWYKIDTNQNGSYDYEEDGWVYGQYLEIYKPSDDSSTGSSGTGTTASTTGTGIVANTYSGVNVRTGAGIAYPAVGKLLSGAQVQILETTTVGTTKWGRVAQGWVCMDYVTMISYDQIPGNTTNSGNGTGVSDLGTVDKTTTTAIYTGEVTNGPVNVYPTTSLSSNKLEKHEIVRVMNNGDKLTIYELITVTELVATDEEDKKPNVEGDGDAGETGAGGSTTVTTVVSYWARVNDGYIYYPEKYISLDPLDEKVHTLTGSETLNVRLEAGTSSEKVGELEKGDQVSVTALKIIGDKVWGRIDTPDLTDHSSGWIRLDYMSEGAYYVQQNTTTNNSTTATTPTIGSTGNTNTGGFVNNTAGYKYTGKVINTNTVNVRSIASTDGAVTTTLSSGQSMVIYETTISENMAWGRCDAGWVYLYYVDLTPAGGNGAIDARVVYNDNTIIYSDSSMSSTTGSTYARMSVIDIYEVVGTMARTDMGWVKTTDLL